MSEKISTNQTQGDRLRHLRSQREVSRKFLADAIGVSQQVIANIESNRTKITSLHTRDLERLCYHLLCTQDYLLMKSDDPTKKDNGFINPVLFNPDFIKPQDLIDASKDFPEAFQLLCKASRLLSPVEKSLLIKVLEAFIPKNY